MRQYFINGNTIERRETSIVIPTINKILTHRNTSQIKSQKY